jgi:hypothetical protein
MNDDKEPDTLPMFRAAPITNPGVFNIIFCSKCGCSYSDKCSNPDHDQFSEKRSHK